MISSRGSEACDQPGEYDGHGRGDGAGVSGLRFVKRSGRNHLIILDTTWAKLVGARKVAGVYRMRSSDLLQKLQAQASSVTMVTVDGASTTMTAADRTPTLTPS